ncbi:MAG: RNA polymerase sigma factor [Candidatus Neomarinimicrobiota bacterium]
MEQSSANNRPDRLLEATVERARQGEVGAYRWLYDRYKDEMYRASLALSRNEYLAEEAIQESFIRMHKNIKTLKDCSKFVPWLYRIVLNATYTTIRRHRNHWVDLDDEQAEIADNENPSRDVWQLLSSALRKLPKGYRNVFVLHYLQELPHEQVAAIMNVSVGTSKSQYHRAREKLRVIFTKMDIGYETV